jgi:hypothetical protein
MMSLGIQRSRRMYSLQTAYKRLALRSPFTAHTASKPLNVINHNSCGTLVDDVLLMVLCLCDISTALTVSRVSFRKINSTLC